MNASDRLYEMPPSCSLLGRGEKRRRGGEQGGDTHATEPTKCSHNILHTRDYQQLEPTEQNKGQTTQSRTPHHQAHAVVST